MTDLSAQSAVPKFSTNLSWTLGSVPLSPVASSELVPIMRKFLARGIPWLQIAHPINGREANYRVVWLTTTEQESLAVIELEPGWLEDGEPPEQNIVRIVNSECIQTLTEDEFPEALSVVKLDAGTGRTMSLVELEEILGPLEETLTAERDSDD